MVTALQMNCNSSRLPSIHLETNHMGVLLHLKGLFCAELQAFLDHMRRAPRVLILADPHDDFGPLPVPRDVLWMLARSSRTTTEASVLGPLLGNICPRPQSLPPAMDPALIRDQIPIGAGDR